jgi:hypothetical protein
LEDLNLFGNPIRDAAISSLQGLDKLQRLNLGDTKITDQGLKSLKELPGLKQLDLARCEITDEGVKHLAELKNLESLKLGETKITDQSIATLKEMTRLQGVTLDETLITPEGLKKLSELPRFSWMASPRQTAEELVRRMELGVFDTVDDMRSLGLDLPQRGQFKLIKLDALEQTANDKQLGTQRFRLEMDWTYPPDKIDDVFFAVFAVDHATVGVHKIGIAPPD